ncbi:MAG: hypothetical protein HYY09_00370, partial [Firmicutes bacterium]|nr:hypothetical protein [Bacillota bacterium]
LDQGEFLSRLLVGETPDHQREIAYNAYRAVDDSAEKSYVEKLEQEMLSRRQRGIQVDNLYSLMDSRRDVPRTLRDVPQTLVEEFELFRVMHKAARCYELNTILGQDPGVQGGREAVLLTLALIKKVIQEEPSPIRLSLGEHRPYLGY